MTSADSPYARDWEKAARKDWGRMRLLLASEDPEGGAYFLQQAVEKYLKAWLLAHGWPLRKTHELPVLLAEICTRRPELTVHEPVCDRLAGYYFSQRYPTLIDPGLTRTDVDNDIAQAAMLLVELFPGESFG